MLRSKVVNMIGLSLKGVQRALFTTNTIYHANSPLTRTEGLIVEKASIPKSKDKKRWNQDDHVSTSKAVYDTLCFKVVGYDMVLVEKYAQTVHRLLQQQKIRVKEMYALPPDIHAVRHSDGSYSADTGNMKIVAELQGYTRVVNAMDMPSTAMSILIQMLSRDVPPGVELSINKYTEEEHLKRFKVNKELEAARDELLKLRISR